ncbi:hypothetical protein [Methylocystis sp. JR02]|uniref:hypothetical protein n=1 Tax=Methylocystis sp. JR02 TaxID=3046284 RepID=UPI0024B99453|nr:hypothetical protein [Methylocystis sp. JR02]MDJ0449262.1 hypothetical protein [Methylocystis sp. JR02]
MPDIVYVDDEPDLAISAQQAPHFAVFRFEDLSDDEAFRAAKEASLWLFDFFLVGHPGAEGRDENGLSLFSKWRGALSRNYPPVAVVSNDLEKVLGSPLGPRARLHVQAQALGVEWLGDKRCEHVVDKLIELAEASRTLASSINSSVASEDAEAAMTIGIQRLCFELLKAPSNARWCRSVERQVDRARPPRITPPIDGVGAARLIIAWLLHQVLPYPSFLLNDTHAAVRLGLDLESFRRVMACECELSKLIGSCIYEGPLKTFDNRRWWGGGIDFVAWELSQEQSDYESAILRKAEGLRVDFLRMEQPVIVSDSDLVETNEVGEARDCVRAADESFPQGVEPAWVKLSDALEDRKLAAKVIYEDQELMDDGNSL